jgi:FMN phosphatase YigB (HAD superfamily)
MNRPIPHFLRNVRAIAFERDVLTRFGARRDGGHRPVDIGAAEIIRTLYRRRYRLVLAANTSAERSRTVDLVHVGIHDLFWAILDSPTLGAVKQDFPFFRGVGCMAGVRPELTLYVSYQLEDVNGATKAGLCAVLLAPPGGPISRNIELPAAAMRLDCLGDLLHLLPDVCPDSPA